MFNLVATLVFLSTIGIIYGYHRFLKYPTPPEISIVEYLDQKYHWNAWGHWLVQFSIVAALALQWPIPVWGLMLPSVVYVVLVEFLVQKNKWSLDTAFDIFTHLSGSATATLLVYPI